MNNHPRQNPAYRPSGVFSPVPASWEFMGNILEIVILARKLQGKLLILL